jgi:hypothetical protein
MHLIERNGNLYVREVIGRTKVYYWPITYSSSDFARRYGAERLARLLKGELINDPGRSAHFGFATQDGIMLPVPNGGQTKPAWIEDLENVQPPPPAQPASRQRRRGRR